MAITVKLSFLLTLLLFSQSYAQQQKVTAETWLQRMAGASAALDYSGVVVLADGNELQTLKVSQCVLPDGRVQEMNSLSSDDLHLVKSPDVFHIKNSSNFAYQYKPSNERLTPAFNPSHLKNIKEYYAFKLHGNEKIAGYKTQIISLNPKDKWRYGYKVWLEERTGMPLKWVWINDSGKILRQLMFSNIKFESSLSLNESIKNDQLIKETEVAFLKTEQINDDHIQDKAWWQSTMKQYGFTFDAEASEVFSVNNEKTSRYVFSDGIATISLYLVEKQPKQRPEVIEGVYGAVSFFCKTGERYQMTLLGEIPINTIRALGAALNEFEAYIK